MKYVTEEDARRNRVKLGLSADNGSWYRLPAGVLEDERLTVSDAVVYAIILDQKTLGNEEVPITSPEIVEKSGLAIATVKRSLKRLKELGYIEGVKKKGMAISYIILPILCDKKTTSKKRIPKEKDDDMSAYDICINNFEVI